MNDEIKYYVYKYNQRMDSEITIIKIFYEHIIIFYNIVYIIKGNKKHIYIEKCYDDYSFLIKI